jgi:uncharacterized membrane protein YfcA
MSDPLPFAIQAIWVSLAAIAAGLINALAGGGSLISFPALTAIGLPALMANVTNTVALAPGYLGATVAQRRELRGQRKRWWLLLPAGAAGGPRNSGPCRRCSWRPSTGASSAAG